MSIATVIVGAKSHSLTSCCRLGLKIAIADVNEEALSILGRELTDVLGEGNVLVVPTDVSKLDDVVRLHEKVYEAWGEVRVFALSASRLVSFPAPICPPDRPSVAVVYAQQIYSSSSRSRF